ncbi:unnamed protein product [Protopolystoma xenopodis]|uniref:Uncharacterized protein n=1 Tax=Protopolystoma xenopodis TaxID=117903 RepID=A0A448WMM8_9PLAT|nr:unnamed protein product [Protopolystoma xenopodis]
MATSSQLACLWPNSSEPDSLVGRFASSFDFVVAGGLAVLALTANLGLLYLARATRLSGSLHGGHPSSSSPAAAAAAAATANAVGEPATWSVGAPSAPLTRRTGSSLSVCSPATRALLPSPGASRLAPGAGLLHSLGSQLSLSTLSISRLLAGGGGGSELEVGQTRQVSRFSLTRGANASAGAGSAGACACVGASASACSGVAAASVGAGSTASGGGRRRHRRYLRGLLALAISNLTIAVCLLVWCLLHLVPPTASGAWTGRLYLANLGLGLADMAQAVEIGAVLWIALERTLAVHWPMPAGSAGAIIGSVTGATAPVCRPRTVGPSPWRRASSLAYLNLFGATGNQSAAACTGILQLPRRLTDDQRPGWLARLGSVVLCRKGPSQAGRSIRPNGARDFRPRGLSRKSECLLRVALCALPLALLFIALLLNLPNWIRASEHRSTPPALDSTAAKAAGGLQPPAGLGLAAGAADSRAAGAGPLSAAGHARLAPSRPGVVYFTEPMLVALIVGQFLAPLGILCSTSIIIYRKVSSDTPLCPIPPFTHAPRPHPGGPTASPIVTWRHGHKWTFSTPDNRTAHANTHTQMVILTLA